MTEMDHFDGLRTEEGMVDLCEVRTLPAATSLDEAMVTFRSAVLDLQSKPLHLNSGTIRFQVPLSPGLKALQWLQAQPQHSLLLPRSYFSPRSVRVSAEEGSSSRLIDSNGVGSVASVGSAVRFKGTHPFSRKDWKTIRRFLSKTHPLIRAYGAMRFNPKSKPSEEWEPFGSFYFFIPQVELCEREGCSLVAVNVTWEESIDWSLEKAVMKSLDVMQMVSTRVCPDNKRPLARLLRRVHVPNESSWHLAVDNTLQLLCESENVLDGLLPEHVDPLHSAGPYISKVVMARRTMLELDDNLDPISLLACLQFALQIPDGSSFICSTEKDPSAYQFALQIPDGSSFIGSTPERLFVRDGLLVASEAVAGTRARGRDPLRDQELGLELMNSAKDHHEFNIVRESVRQHMEMVCRNVGTEISKCLIKQDRVQHLYARFSGELAKEDEEFDLLSVLHPTPAVCGHPQTAAREAISRSEAFDRGFYAGPVGWIGGGGAEFAVGIRSSLIKTCLCSLPEVSHSHGDRNGTVRRRTSFQDEYLDVGNSDQGGKGNHIFLYAGVGVVKDSKSSSEWRELELKISQFEALLGGSEVEESSS